MAEEEGRLRGTVGHPVRDKERPRHVPRLPSARHAGILAQLYGSTARGIETGVDARSDFRRPGQL